MQKWPSAPSCSGVAVSRMTPGAAVAEASRRSRIPGLVPWGPGQVVGLIDDDEIPSRRGQPARRAWRSARATKEGKG